MTTLRPISAQYDELARRYGFEAVWNCMDEVSQLGDDDNVTPADRLARVQANLSLAYLGHHADRVLETHDLRVRLAEVNGALAGDAGDWRATLERLKARLEAALQ